LENLPDEAKAGRNNLEFLKNLEVEGIDSRKWKNISRWKCS
jgi:hypothetical protein